MRRRGFSLAELMVATGIMSLLFFGMTALFLTGLKSLNRTQTDTDISQRNAQGIRRVLETIRQSVNVTVSSDGNTITYSLPKLTNAVDPVTGEKEYVVPMISDGVAHQFHVANGQLIDNDSGKVLVDSLVATDPDPNSSQYGDLVPPFQLNTIGSGRAVTVNLIASVNLGTTTRTSRMKSTVLLRNVQ